MNKKEIQSKLDEIVDFSGCERYIDTPVKRYSSGMMVRLGFAVAAHLDPEILVVDEVLAVGDAEFQKKAIGKMQDVSKGEGRTVLFVSHNMAAVKQLCVSGILLENGVVKYTGTASRTIDYYLNGYTTNKSEIFVNNNVVKRIKAQQNGSKINISLEYSSEAVISQPNFGFVIFDQYQMPIFGTNPLKSGIKDFGTSSKNGMIDVSIDSPVLYDGLYYVGVWFSDGLSKHFYANDRCVTLNIEGMSFSTFSKTVSEEGYVVPSCNWSFITK